MNSAEFEALRLIAAALFKVLSKEQILAFLEEIASQTVSYCPVCATEFFPDNIPWNKVDPSQAAYWKERHDSDCLVVLLLNEVERRVWGEEQKRVLEVQQKAQAAHVET